MKQSLQIHRIYFDFYMSRITCLDLNFIKLCFLPFHSWLARTDPGDVARVESKTVISTEQKYDTVPHAKSGVKGTLGTWMSPEDLETALDNRFPGCMRGKWAMP